MSASILSSAAVSVRAVSVYRSCFAPFGKGGYAPKEVPLGGGGFALRVIEEQEQIPLDPPFSKGEKKPHRVLVPISHAGESSMQAAA